MPKTDSAKKALKNFQDQYGKEKGEQIYHATAKKQGRDSDTFEKKESLRLVGDIAIEHDGQMTVIGKGTIVYEVNDLEHNGIVKVYNKKTGKLVSTGQSGDLGMRIAKMNIDDQPIPDQKHLQIWVGHRPLEETVGTGAIAMIPHALGEEEEEEEVEEASNSQVSELNLDY